MEHTAQILGSYGLTLGGIAAFTLWMLRRGRSLAAQASDEERPWT